MKKVYRILLIVLIVFVSIPLLVVGITTIQYNRFKPEGLAFAVNGDDLKYFQESYEECRSAFLRESDKLRETFEGVQISSFNVPSARDNDLTIDYCLVPAQNKTERLLILSSGVHGVEGYAGSAIQQMFMNELTKENRLETMGVLLIHGINPYGFKYNRRVSENNIDLNRNCMAVPDDYDEFGNQGYRDLNHWLNPRDSVNLRSGGNRFFQVGSIRNIIKYSMGALRQATLQGQYDFEKGIIYGGQALEPPIEAVTPLIREVAASYGTVFNIDLHTGYGTFGTLHLFPKPLEDPEKQREIESVFEGYQIDWGDSDDFYTYNGDFTSYIGGILPGKNYLTMTFEAGTNDTQTTMGSIYALHSLVLENQGTHFGYASPEDEAKVSARFLEGYYSSSEVWRSKIVSDAREMLDQAVENFLVM